MANRKGLGVSKKFANGTIHEVATGKFMIQDRFTEDDDNIPMLEFQWLTGEKEGQTEINKEINMNSSIHKFNVAMGRPTVVQPQNVASSDDLPFLDKLDAIYEHVQENCDLCNTVKMIGQNSEANREFVNKFFVQLGDVQECLKKQQETISQLTNQIERMINTEQLLAKAEDAILRQQETLNKLVEKI